MSLFYDRDGGGCICVCYDDERGSCEAEGCFGCTRTPTGDDGLCDACREFCLNQEFGMPHCHVYDLSATPFRKETDVAVKGGYL